MAEAMAAEEEEEEEEDYEEMPTLLDEDQTAEVLASLLETTKLE